MSQQSSRSWLPIYTCAVSGAVSMGAILATAWFLQYRKQYVQRQRERNIRNELLDAFYSPSTFTLKEVRVATKYFAKENLVGAGGFGEVYKGVLPNGDLVAVKVLTRELHKGEAAFRMEVQLIANMRHQNLVMLRGFCAEGLARILVYDYLPNGSLDRHLFGCNPGTDFSWDKRFRVALTTARGLAYLHDGCSCGLIIHRDLKPGNVLLTDDFDARICDFGLARLANSDASHASISGMAGTMGYLPPEAVTGKLTDKYDVFSFGVILFQLITGRKVVCNSYEQTHIISWVRQRLDAGEDFVSLADPNLQNKNDEQIEACGIVALLCVDRKASQRPSMSKVVQMLAGNVLIPLPPLHVRRGHGVGSTSTSSELLSGKMSGLGPEVLGGWRLGCQNESIMSGSTDSRESSERTADTSTSSISRNSTDRVWSQPQPHRRRRRQKDAGVSSSRSWHRPVKLPHSRNMLFRGREAYLAEMHRKLHVKSGQVSCLSISGMGGVGKTQLALEYAYRYFDEYDGVLWVDAAKDVRKNYAALAKWLGIQAENTTSEEEQVEMVRSMLEGEFKLLLILDDIDEEQLELLRPKVGASHVVLTSRIRLTYLPLLQLESMSIEDALEVLRSREESKEGDCEPILREIAQKLGMLPWALSAVSQILSNGDEPRKFLSRLTKDAVKALEHAPVESTFYSCTSLAGLFEDSIKSLHSGTLEDSKLAVAMFDVAGFFSPHTIPLTLLVLSAHFRLGHELEWSEDADDGEMAIVTLVRLNLAQRPKDKEVVFHCMLQAYSRSRDTDGSACAAVLRTLANSVLTRRTYMHMQAMWQLYEGRLKDGNFDAVELERVIDVGIHIGEYWFQFGTSHVPDTMKLLDAIISVGPAGGKMRMVARHAKIYALLRVVYDRDTALQELKDVLSEITPELEGNVTTLCFRIMYAQLTWRNWSTDEEDRVARAGLQDLSHAMDAFTEKAKVLIRQHTRPSPWGKYEARSRELDLLTVALNNLGWLFTTYSVDYQKALELYSSVLTISDHVLKPRHVQQYGYGSIVQLYTRLEHDARIWCMLKAAFALQPGATATWIHLQSTVLEKAEGVFGSPEEREAKRRHLEDAVKFYNKVSSNGEGNDWLATNMAAALGELGLVTPAPGGERYLQQAIGMLEQEISVMLQQAGRKTTEVNSAHFRLAVIYRYLGGKAALETSRRLLVECIRVEASLGVSSQQKMGGMLLHLGQICLKLGLLDEALPHLQRALRLRSQYYGDRSIRVGQAMEMLALLYWLKGETGKSLMHLEQALSIREKHYEAGDPQLTFLQQVLRQQRDLQMTIYPVTEGTEGEMSVQVDRSFC